MAKTIKNKKVRKSLAGLSLNLKQADEFYNTGVAHHRKNILDEAISCYNSAIKLNPKHDMALYCLGIAMQEKDRLDEAIDCYERSLNVNPNNAMTHNNLGFILEKRGRIEEAICCYEKALQINPQFAIALNNLGNAFSVCGRIDDAIVQYEKALKIKPNYAHAFSNLGNILHKKGRLGEAIDYYRKAIQINPHLIDAHWNLSHVLLKSGDFLRGWKEYEWRWQLKEYGQRNYPQPLWDGTSLNGKKIFVYAEQGIGDVVMFASCLPEIIEQAEECMIECDARLIPLFARSFPKAYFVESLQEGDAFPSNLLSYDVKMPIGSLPRYLRQDYGSFPQRHSYLIPDLQEVEKWIGRFKEAGKGLRIGISWMGGKYLSVKKERSIPLEKWNRLFALKGLHFINLQYGDCADEVREVKRRLGITIHDWDDADPLKNLDNFAAQISALDLVISVDNSTAHIAGALGVPVWTLLPFNCEWRWMQAFTDSPWYKSMRLFRQKIPGDWDGVIDNLLPVINDLVSSEYVSEMADEHSCNWSAQ